MKSSRMMAKDNCTINCVKLTTIPTLHKGGTKQGPHQGLLVQHHMKEHNIKKKERDSNNLGIFTRDIRLKTISTTFTQDMINRKRELRITLRASGRVSGIHHLVMIVRKSSLRAQVRIFTEHELKMPTRIIREELLNLLTPLRIRIFQVSLTVVANIKSNHKMLHKIMIRSQMNKRLKRINSTENFIRRSIKHNKNRLKGRLLKSQNGGMIKIQISISSKSGERGLNLHLRPTKSMNQKKVASFII